jgi:hypothetical protein
MTGPWPEPLCKADQPYPIHELPMRTETGDLPRCLDTTRSIRLSLILIPTLASTAFALRFAGVEMSLGPTSG